MIQWIVGGIAALVMAGCAMALGIALLPDRSTVVDAGTLVPWYFAWLLVLITTGIALTLAGYLFKNATGGHAHH